MRTSIIKSREYLEIIEFMLIKCHKYSYAKSYEITDSFNENLKKETDPVKRKQIRNNFSMKLQNLLKLRFIKKIGTGSRGRGGKYSKYILDYEGLTDYFLKNYFPFHIKMIEGFQKSIKEMYETIIKNFGTAFYNEILFSYQIPPESDEDFYNELTPYFFEFHRDFTYRNINNLDELFSYIKEEFAFQSISHMSSEDTNDLFQ